jgi:hypothetical protein
MDNQTVGFIALALILPLLLLSLKRRRQALAFNIYYLSFGGLIGLFAFVLTEWNAPVLRPSAVAIGVLVTLLIYAMRPARVRRIPTSLRRLKIAEWEHKTGKRFNPRKHDLDHIVAFSKGGGHTPDNLQVLEKDKNRSKGTRGPWWDILGLW